MTKHDYIWAAIRIFGIYLLILAIIAIPEILSSAYSTWIFLTLHSGDSSVHPMMNLNTKLQTFDLSSVIYKTAAKTASIELARSFGRFFVCGGVGIYLIKSGKIIFKWVCPPDANDSTENR